MRINNFISLALRSYSSSYIFFLHNALRGGKEGRKEGAARYLREDRQCVGTRVPGGRQGHAIQGTDDAPFTEHSLGVQLGGGRRAGVRWTGCILASVGVGGRSKKR